MFFFIVYRTSVNFYIWPEAPLWGPCTLPGGPGWFLTPLSSQGKYTKHLSMILMSPRPYMTLSIQVLCRQLSTTGPYSSKCQTAEIKPDHGKFS